ncbi:hypothetical protein EDD85DRAFT_940070 [Armillaria nabsnona]|nr:hypothetical protein EDD85DRAFT_940070 [Armillaria nabsnona]
MSVVVVALEKPLKSTMTRRSEMAGHPLGNLIRGWIHRHVLPTCTRGRGDSYVPRTFYGHSRASFYFIRRTFSKHELSPGIYPHDAYTWENAAGCHCIIISRGAPHHHAGACWDLERMRSYSNPWGTHACGVDGKGIFNRCVPGGHISACQDECSFYVTLLRAPHARDDEGRAILGKAKKMPTLFPHDIVFTHGDLWDQGHVSGIVDWECAGWQPEYWEYTLILQWTGIREPWALWLATLPGYKYSEEME